MNNEEKIRQIHIYKQYLDYRENDPLKLVKELGWIQIDTIAVISRSQDLVLHSRAPNYSEEEIWKFLKKGKIFEGFAHAKSLIHSDYFPFYYSEALERRKRQKFLKKNNAWLEKVLDHLEGFESFSTVDIPLPEGVKNKRGRWNSTQKGLLNLLNHNGYILATSRDSFNKPLYSLSERVLKISDDLPSGLDTFWFKINSTLNATGYASKNRLLGYYYLKRFKINGKTYDPMKLIETRVKEGTIKMVLVNGVKYYYKPEIEDLDLEGFKGVRFLSPFDNLLWSREALLEQFGFKYVLECYLPVAKRSYGFFNLPILYMSDFVGRVDMKLDRKTGIMKFNSWHWHPKPKEKLFWEELNITLNNFLQFHNTTEIKGPIDNRIEINL